MRIRVRLGVASARRAGEYRKVGHVSVTLRTEERRRCVIARSYRELRVAECRRRPRRCIVALRAGRRIPRRSVCRIGRGCVVRCVAGVAIR
jgi:hypothetical protein